jgi:group II intron reverse transcriptase/maturase
LDANLDQLVRRLKGQSYQARLVRRKYIPKGDGKRRPLGILVLEDKLVQCAVTQILLAIYEADFLPCSYGYRPGRGPQMAVRELTDELHWGKHNFVVEFDIKGFFDHVRHDLLLEMLARRIQDGALLRLIRKWLKAGVLEEDGSVIHPELGTPQGGVVSPVLANVYLHYALDVWFEEQVRKPSRGGCRLFRFADDFVGGFGHRHEAEAMERELPPRLAQFGLEVAPDKTKRLRFGRNGGEYNGRFGFLGFEFRWEPDRKGRPTVKRRTAPKKLQGAVKRMGSWLRTHRHWKLPKLMEWLAMKLRGHWNYYGIRGNSRSLSRYEYAVQRLLYKWLNRRSQKRSFTWRALQRILKRFHIPRPRIVERLRQGWTETVRTVATKQVETINLFGDAYRSCRALSEL